MIMSSDDYVTLGDLHGNALKLLYSLVAFDIVSISRTGYYAFVRIYQTKEWDKAQLHRLREIIAEIRVNPKKLRLLGDMLCDRGHHDFLTLLLIDTLIKQGCELKIIASNHDVEFLRYAQTDQQCLSSVHSQSLQNTLAHIERGLITKDEFDNLVETFVGHVILADTEVNGSRLYIYTHAPVPLPTIYSAAEQLCVDGNYCLKEHEDVILMIEALNVKFSEALGEIETLFSYYYAQNFYQGGYTNHPVGSMLWNREAICHTRFTLPATMIHVHGHNQESPDLLCQASQVINLDTTGNNLGRPGWMRGQLTFVAPTTRVIKKPVCDPRLSMTMGGAALTAALEVTTAAPSALLSSASAAFFAMGPGVMTCVGLGLAMGTAVAMKEICKPPPKLNRQSRCF